MNICSMSNDSKQSVYGVIIIYKIFYREIKALQEIEENEHVSILFPPPVKASWSTANR